MQSDPRVAAAFAALARPIAGFRTALSGALEQAEAFIASEGLTADERTERLRTELGRFAGPRIDASRFAAVFGVRREMPRDTRERLERAIAVLRDVLDRGDDLFLVDVPPGGSLPTAVADALGRAGRAFRAVLAIELLRGGRFDAAEHDALLDRLEFRAWTRNERRYAPPLVVRVHGADLQVSALQDYLDGREKLVLVVDAPCAPAPLVRLVTPGTLVLQATDPAALDVVAATDGPAVAALVPGGTATFLHDPRLGRESWQRLSVWSVPEAPRKAIGAASAWQMREDLRQLEALAAAPIGAPLPVEAGTGAGDDGAVDKLASWLLKQSGLTGPA
jgi:hypothetical protein